MRQKKAQMEILGLAVIVVLITLSMLFVVKFVVLKEPSTIRKTYTQTEIAANTLSALLKSTTKDCYGTSMTELFQDCATLQTMKCEDGNYSCSYIDNTVRYILNNTLNEWGKSYEFKAHMAASPNLLLFNISRGYCGGEKESKNYIVPTNFGDLTVKLDICG